MPTVKNISATKGSSGHYQVIVEVTHDSGNSVKKVRVTIPSTGNQPAAEPSTIDLDYDKTVDEIRYFNNSNTTLNFSSNAVGEEYQMTAKMLDATNQSIGQSTQSVVVGQAEPMA